MLVETDGNKGFIIDHKFGFDFCRALEKCSPKNDFVYLSCDGSTFYLYAQSQSAVVLGAQNVENGHVFSMGVESSKFVALFKRLYEGSPIKVRPIKNTLTVSEDNISVKFPAAAYVKQPTLPEMVYLNGNDTESISWLAESIDRCGGAIGETARFPGVLIDNTSSEICRIINFSETAIRLCARPKLALWDGTSWSGSRFVISPEMPKALHVFRDEVENFMFNQNLFGFRLRSSVLVLSALLHDELPVSYAESLSLRDSVMQVEPSGRKYVFNKQRFLEVLDLVSTVIGSEESLLLCEIEGVSAASQCPIWKVSAKTYNGCEASERAECLTTAATDMPPFRIHKNRAISAIKLHQEHLVLYDKDETFLIVTDETGADVTLLIKAPA